MVLNTLGPVIVFDGENPRTFTGRARETISGGALVVVSGAANVVGSDSSTFLTSDIVVNNVKDSDYCNGIALNNAGSNDLVTVARRGDFLVRCADVISGGQCVIPFSGTINGVKAQSTTISYSGTTIGRSITASASGTNNYALVSFNL